MGNIMNTKDLNTETIREYVITGIEEMVSTLIRNSILENTVCEDHIHPGLHVSVCKKTFLKYIKEDLVVDGYVIGLETLLNIEIINILKDILVSNDMSYILSSSVKEDFYSMYKIIYTENDNKDIIDINNVHVFNVTGMTENVIEMLNRHQVELNGIKYGIVFSIKSKGKILDWYEDKLENFVLKEILEKTTKAYIDSVKANLVPENKIETTASMKPYRGSIIEPYRGTDFYVNLDIKDEFMDIRKKVLERSCLIKISKDPIGGKYSVVVYGLSFYIKGDDITVFMIYDEPSTKHMCDNINTYNLKERYEKGEFHIVKVINVDIDEEDDED